jgi:hypothetical protein
MKNRKQTDKINIEPMILNQADAYRLYRRQVIADAVEAGWLKPCCVKPGKKNSVYYSVSDLKLLGLRMANGEYPLAA